MSCRFVWKRCFRRFVRCTGLAPKCLVHEKESVVLEMLVNPNLLVRNKTTSRTFWYYPWDDSRGCRTILLLLLLLHELRRNINVSDAQFTTTTTPLLPQLIFHCMINWKSKDANLDTYACTCVLWRKAELEGVLDTSWSGQGMVCKVEMMRMYPSMMRSLTVCDIETTRGSRLIFALEFGFNQVKIILGHEFIQPTIHHGEWSCTNRWFVTRKTLPKFGQLYRLVCWWRGW